MSDHPSAELQGVFGRPFTEQVAFFRNKLKNLVPTRRWNDMVGAAHDDAFMVAGAAKADLLTDLAAAVDKALAEGRGIEEFRRDFRSIVARNGWTGWTGEGSVRGEAWRVKTILSTNAYTSYSAGRRAQLMAGNFPWWVYRHGGSLEPRPQHLAWDGLALPPDHEFWVYYFGPSDWGCSCYVVGASTEAGIRRVGGDPQKRLSSDWKKIDPKTGTLPGIGKGWDYAPGASVSPLISAMAAKVRNWDYGIARTFMAGLPVDRQDALSHSYRQLPSTADDVRRLAAALQEERLPRSAPKQIKSLGMVSQEQQDAIAALIGRSLNRSDFRVSTDFVIHALDEHTNPAIELSRGQRAIVPGDFGRLPLLLDAPDAISEPDVSRRGETTVIFRRRFGAETYVAVVVVNRRQDNLSLKTFYVQL